MNKSILKWYRRRAREMFEDMMDDWADEILTRAADPDPDVSQSASESFADEMYALADLLQQEAALAWQSDPKVVRCNNKSGLVH